MTYNYNSTCGAVSFNNNKQKNNADFCLPQETVYKQRDSKSGITIEKPALSTPSFSYDTYPGVCPCSEGGSKVPFSGEAGCSGSDTSSSGCGRNKTPSVDYI